MNMRQPRAICKRLPVLLGCVLLSLLLVFGGARTQTVPNAEEGLIYSVKGPDLFRTYCAVCHGPNGKGDGPMASALKAQVPDLTLLAKNNKGQFPSVRVRTMIAGGETVKSHGSREMPIWGPIFHQVEYDQDLGNVRLENLVKYLEWIQQK
jgi:mono/diheme cytochrome c family protein